MKYVATISGGKDSVTMCDLLLKTKDKHGNQKYPVDYIVFSDTLIELPQMYSYIEKLKKYFLERYRKEIIVTKPNKTFEQMVFGIINQKGAERIGWIKGIPNPMLGFCEWRRESKIYPYDREMKKILGDEEYKTYIGFTTDERNRKLDNENIIYPLIDYFNMSERDCQEYLIKQDMENPIYRFLTRSGCACCPAQSDKAFFEIWKNSKYDWEYMKFIENRLSYYISLGYKVVNRYWFDGERNIETMEKKFIEADKQGSLFDFSDEPVKDCFCKI